MRPLHTLATGLLALTLIAGTSVFSQSSLSRTLIVDKVDENQLTTLRGNTPPAATAQNDLGRVNAGLPLTDLILVLRRSPETQAAFDAFVASQYDASSPNYHHWLEPEEVGEKFGPSPADIATVSAWLSGHGLSVDGISKDRMAIRFSGSARLVEATFHTELHNLSVKGEPHFSNMTDPQIPMALEPVVIGPKALHNFIARPLHRLGGKVTLNKDTGAWQRATGPDASRSPLRPEIGFSCGTSCEVEDVTPRDFATIYNVLPLWTAGTPIDGTGQTIAIAGRSDVRASDVTTFRNTFGLTGGAFNLIKNGTDPGYCTGTSGLCTLDDQIENALDSEWTGAIAPKATIDLVVTQQTNSNDAIYESASYAIQHKTAPVLNVSYGNCELFLGTSGNAAYNTLWQGAATTGIGVFVASGDAGAPSCDQGGAAQGPYGAHFGLAVSGIASTPYNTAVGGTDLNWSTLSQYWNTSNGTNGATAKGYIPETPWNDTCTNPVEVAIINNALGQSLTASQICYEIAVGQIQSSNPAQEQSVLDLVNTTGAGGGVSNCTTNSTTSTTTNPDPTSCSQGYAKPAWQTGVAGIPSDGKRDIPDVSFFAGNGFFGSAYLICVSDWGTCVTSTSSSSASEPGVGEIGGTSAASPAMAGVMALINQKAGSPQGNPNAELYILAGKQNYANCSTESVTNSSSCYFNDIDTGTISMPCAAGSPSCTVAQSGNTIGILSGYSAGAGFDTASGLGSLNVANVVNGWSSAIGSAATTVTVAASPSSFTSAQGTTVTVTVAGSSGTPTGTVVLTSGTYTSSSKSLSGGTVSFSIASGSLAVGSDTITASYSGDATYAAKTGTTQVTVTQAALLTPTVTVVPASGSIDSGQSLNVTATVAGTGGTPTGTVTLSGGGFTSSAQTLSGGSATIAIAANKLSAGSDTLTVNYSGDSVYTTASGSAPVTVTASVFAMTATTPAAISRGASAQSTVSVTSATNYSGSVTLSCALTSGPSNQTGDAPTCSPQAAGISAGSSGTVTVATVAATTAAMQKPHIGGWAQAGSGCILALLVFLGIPARRRGWRAMAGIVVLMIALGSLAACGGGGGSGGGNSNPGTASGAYTFTVTGTGSPAISPAPTTTFTVTVN